eukprot:1472952-Pleurochrysis_carterae.AAC.3
MQHRALSDEESGGAHRQCFLVFTKDHKSVSTASLSAKMIYDNYMKLLSSFTFQGLMVRQARPRVSNVRRSVPGFEVSCPRIFFTLET